MIINEDKAWKLKEFYICFHDKGGDMFRKQSCSIVYANTARQAVYLFKRYHPKGHRQIKEVIEWVSGRTQVNHKIENNKIVTT